MRIEADYAEYDDKIIVNINGVIHILDDRDAGKLSFLLLSALQDRSVLMAEDDIRQELLNGKNLADTRVDTARENL